MGLGADHGWLKATVVFANFLSHEFARGLTWASRVMNCPSRPRSGRTTSLLYSRARRLLDVGHGDAGVIMTAQTGHAVGLRYGCACRHRGTAAAMAITSSLLTRLSLSLSVGSLLQQSRQGPPGTATRHFLRMTFFEKRFCVFRRRTFGQAVASAAAPRVNQPGSTDGSGMASINMRV